MPPTAERSTSPLPEVALSCKQPPTVPLSPPLHGCTCGPRLPRCVRPGSVQQAGRAQTVRRKQTPEPAQTPMGRTPGVCACWQPLPPHPPAPGLRPARLVFPCTWLLLTSSQRPWQACSAGLKWDLPGPQGYLTCRHGDGQTSPELTFSVRISRACACPQYPPSALMGSAYQIRLISRVDVFE